jgi:hypothetical protein
MNRQPGPGDSVRCHSGHTYAQRPMSFVYSGEEHQVARVIAEKRLPEGKQFLVADASGKVFDLLYDEPNDAWQVQLA